MAKLTLQCGDRQFIKGERPVIMGIINVTPNSFSDGNDYFTPESAVERGLELMAQGADVLDIGGVSTAPHAPAVSAREESARVLPVIDGLVKHGVTSISLDTSNGYLAAEAILRGAAWINDQSAAIEGGEVMAQAMLKAQAVVLMHSRGQSGVLAGETVQYDNLLGEISDFFTERIAALTSLGLARHKIIVDPGVGFGKGLDDTLKLLANMHEWADVASWSLIGASRKSFLGRLTGIANPKDRDFATMGAHMAAVLSGADIIRTHNVQATHEMLQVFNACLKHQSRSLANEDLYQAGR